LSNGEDLVPEGESSDTTNEESDNGHDERNGVERGVKGERLRGEVGDPGVKAGGAESTAG